MYCCFHAENKSFRQELMCIQQFYLQMYYNYQEAGSLLYFMVLLSSSNKEPCNTYKAYAALFHLKGIINQYIRKGRLLETCMFSHTNFSQWALVICISMSQPAGMNCQKSKYYSYCSEIKGGIHFVDSIIGRTEKLQHFKI